MRAVVVGSGVSGLGAALRLRAQGHEVVVLEARECLGGKIHRVEERGFTFDAGPSFLTQPWRLDALFALFGEQRSDHLSIEPVDPSVSYHWRDGTTLVTPRDRAALVDQLATLGPRDRIEAYLDTLASQYDVVAAPFVDSDVLRPGFWLSPRTLLRMTSALGMLGRTFYAYNQSWFPEHPRLVQLLCRYATYAGSDPYAAPSFMASIADVELRQGIFYPGGGMRSVAEALIALGKRHGVQYRTNAAVTGVLGEGRVQAVTVGEEPVRGDLFVSAIDPQHLAPLLGRELSTAPRALSALIWFLGVEAAPLPLHSIFFSDAYRTEFEHFRNGTFHDDLTVYVNHSGARTPSHAPPGLQNWFVMVNAPADFGQDWQALQADLRPTVLQRLEESVGPVQVHSESTYTPLDIARTSGAWKGAIYGPASNSLFSLFQKQPARDREFPNLVHCGGSSHPGGGIPMCLASAEIAVETLRRSGRAADPSG